MRTTLTLDQHGPQFEFAQRQASDLFSPRSFWNTPLEDDHPQIQDWYGYAARLRAQFLYTTTSTPVKGWYGAGYQTILNYSKWSVPIYHVPADQPTQKVTWMTNSGRGPAATEDQVHGLQATWDAVPVPTLTTDLAAGGTDRHVCIWREPTDELWEFWLWNQNTDGTFWAGYGGYYPDVSKHGGVLPNGWGARASGLALPGGVIRMREFYDGVIPHALAFSCGDVADRGLPPATRYDGPAANNPAGDKRNQIPEGSRFRLPPGTQADPAAPPLAKLMVDAARDYGIVCVDKTGGTLGFYLEDPKTVGTGYSSVDTSPWTSGIAWTDLPWGKTNLIDKWFPSQKLVQIA